MAEQKRKPASEATVESLFFDAPEGLEGAVEIAPLPTKEETVESLFFDDPTAGMAALQPDIEFSEAEKASRGVTSLLKGYTFGASELARAPLTVAANRFERLLQEKKFDEAQSFAQEWDDELRRQQMYESQYPIFSATMEGLGAINPMSLPTKAAGLLWKGTDTLGKKMAGMAAESGLQGVAYQAAASPSDDRNANMVIGGALSGAIGGGIPLVGKGIEKTAQTDLAQGIVAKLFGVSKKLQNKYVADAVEIDKAPTKEEAARVFQELQDRLKLDDVAVANEIEKTKQLIAKHQQELAIEAKRVGEERAQELKVKQEELGKLELTLTQLQTELQSKVDQTAKIQKSELEGAEVKVKEAKQAAKEELDDTIYAQETRQQAELSAAKRGATLAQREFAEQSKVPRAEPEVQAVEDALETLMGNAMTLSKEAQDLLDPTVRVSRDVVLDAIKTQQSELVVPGTGFAAGPMSDARQELTRLVKLATDPEDGLPKDMTGEQAKKFLLMVSARLNELKAQGKGSDAPYSYSHPTFNALFKVYGSVSKALKEASDSYAKAMEKTAPLFDLYEQLTKTNFKTPAQIRSSLNRSTVDPKVAEQLASLKEKTGIDVTDYMARRKHAETLKSYGPRQAAIEMLPAVQQLAILEEKIAATKSPKARRELEKSLPMYQKMVEQEAQLEAIKRSGQTRLESTPEYQQLQETKKLISLAKGNAFAQDVLNQVQDKQTAQQIITLFNTIEALKNPIDAAHQTGMQMSLASVALQDAEKRLKDLQTHQAQLKKYLQDIAIGGGDYPGENIVERILHDPHNEQMTPTVVKMLRAIDEMDIETFNRYISQIAYLKPGQVEQTMQNLRIRTAMDEPLDKAARLRTWRTVVLLSTLQAADLAFGQGVLGESMKESTSYVSRVLPYAISAYGGWILGEYMTTHGGAITRSYLKRAYAIQGVPSIQKLVQASPMKVSDAMRVQLTFAAQHWVERLPDESRQFVAAQNVPMIELDIHASDMPMSDKIKALNELRTKGTISNRTFKRLVMQGAVEAGPEQTRDTRLNFFQEPQPEEMLSRMAKRKKAT